MARVEADGSKIELVLTPKMTQATPSPLNPPSNEKIIVRHCKSIEDYEHCVALEKQVWGYSDSDVIPLRVFVVAGKIGGQIIGSFDGKRMVGFALAIPGIRDGRPYLHSHMLAVDRDYRDLGLGQRMKWAQREDAIERGIDLIEWTFDPLEIKNAYLNIERLGAVVRRYVPNLYGYSSSPLQGGLPTDRIIAEWWLLSERVKERMQGSQAVSPSPESRVEVPAEIYSWKASEHEKGKAQELQARNRGQLMDAFESGLAIIGYERDAHGNGAFLLGEWNG